jgi:hypothetical protein
MAKSKSKAVAVVADGVCFDVPKEQADRWFHYFDAECGGRGWNSSEMGQLERRENSGSITITAGANGHQLAVVWERKRGGALKVRANPAGPPGPPEFPAGELKALFDRINEQCTPVEW